MTSTARFVWFLVAVAAAGLLALAFAAPPAVGRARPTLAAAPAADDAVEPPEPDESPGETPGPADGPALAPAGAANAKRPTEAARMNAAFAAAMAVESPEGSVAVALGGLRRGELGAGLLACLHAAAPADFGQARDKLGFDPVEAVERFGLAGELAVVSGRFAGARWAEISPEKPSAYGEHGRLYGPADGQGETLGVWRDEVMVVGRGRAEVQAALDRIEGRARPAAALRGAASRSGGEIHGHLPAAEVLAPLFMFPFESFGQADGGDARGLLVDVLRESKLVADYRVDVVDGGLQLGVVLRAPASEAVAGTPYADPEALDSVLESVAQSLRAGLAGLKAQAPEGSPEGLPGLPAGLAGVLGRTRIANDPDGLHIELDVPAADVRALLAQCGPGASP